MDKLRRWMVGRTITEVVETDEEVLIYFDDGHSLLIGPHPDGYVFTLDPDADDEQPVFTMVQ